VVERDLAADVFEYYRIFQNNPHDLSVARETEAMAQIRPESLT
jgi:hypothetical protein